MEKHNAWLGVGGVYKIHNSKRVSEAIQQGTNNEKSPRKATQTGQPVSKL